MSPPEHQLPRERRKLSTAEIVAIGALFIQVGALVWGAATLNAAVVSLQASVVSMQLDMRSMSIGLTGLVTDVRVLQAQTTLKGK